MSTYYTQSPQVIDGDIAYAEDVNSINNEVNTAFLLLEAWLLSLEGTVSQYADLAESWAVGPGGDYLLEIEPGLYSSKKYALDSSASASSASASASTATTQAGIATTGANTATTQAGIATTQAGISTTQAGISTTKANESSVSAAAALVSETNAAASAASTAAEVANHAALTVTHGVTGAIVGTTNTQTLTNKTLTTPTVSGTGFTNMNHTHAGASTGGLLDHVSLTNKGTNTHAQIDTHISSTPSDGHPVGTSHLQLPPGTTAQRPVSPVNGMIRYNTDLSSFEGYVDGAWGTVGGGATGAVQNPVFYENDTNVTGSYSITSGKNAMSAGPITVDNGVTVTVPNGSVWTVV